MKYLTGLFYAGLLACVLFVSAAFAQRDLAKEQPYYDQLRKTAPKAVETFKTATVALDEKKFADAIIGYREVLKASPDFTPALRRMAYCLTALGNRDEALKTSKKALDTERNPDNLTGYALILVGADQADFKPTQADISQALVLVREAYRTDTTNDSDYAVTYAQMAMRANDANEFDIALRALKSRFPEEAETHYFSGIDLAGKSDFAGAEAEIRRAEALGMSTEFTGPVLESIGEFKNEQFFGLARYMTYFYIGLGVVILWAIGLLALFVVGKSLSAKTLHSIETGDPHDIAGTKHASLKSLYRKLISFGGVYWYLSQPVIMLIVLVATGGGILFFFWIGTIPIKLVIIIAFIGLGTLFVMVKSLFVRTKMEDPGRALTEREAPGMWRTVREVAEVLKTRPVNEIRITPGTDLAVYERGGMRAKMNDKAERILILGTAVLNDFDQNAFRAVLAHEYGHFSNRDTAGGDIAFRVNDHIFRLAEGMGKAGTATAYNIAFQFLRVYHFIFRRITHGATRLQEVLADRVAVYQYGAEAFEEGLRHVIRREAEFAHLADKEINASFSSDRALQNLYELTLPEDNESEKLHIEDQLKEAVERATTEDDTHPSPSDRFKLAARIRSRAGIMRIEGQVWDLFTDRAALTAEMNKQIEANIRAAS